MEQNEGINSKNILLRAVRLFLLTIMFSHYAIGQDADAINATLDADTTLWIHGVSAQCETTSSCLDGLAIPKEYISAEMREQASNQIHRVFRECVTAGAQKISASRKEPIFVSLNYDEPQAGAKESYRCTFDHFSSCRPVEGFDRCVAIGKATLRGEGIASTTKKMLVNNDPSQQGTTESSQVPFVLTAETRMQFQFNNQTSRSSVRNVARTRAELSVTDAIFSVVLNAQSDEFESFEDSTLQATLAAQGIDLNRGESQLVRSTSGTLQGKISFDLDFVEDRYAELMSEAVNVTKFDVCKDGCALTNGFTLSLVGHKRPVLGISPGAGTSGTFRYNMHHNETYQGTMRTVPLSDGRSTFVWNADLTLSKYQSRNWQHSLLSVGSLSDGGTMNSLESFRSNWNDEGSIATEARIRPYANVISDFSSTINRTAEGSTTYIWNGREYILNEHAMAVLQKNRLNNGSTETTGILTRDRINSRQPSQNIHWRGRPVKSLEELRSLGSGGNCGTPAACPWRASSEPDAFIYVTSQDGVPSSGMLQAMWGVQGIYMGFNPYGCLSGAIACPSDVSQSRVFPTYTGVLDKINIINSSLFNFPGYDFTFDEEALSRSVLARSFPLTILPRDVVFLHGFSDTELRDKPAFADQVRTVRTILSALRVRGVHIDEIRTVDAKELMEAASRIPQNAYVIVFMHGSAQALHPGNPVASELKGLSPWQLAAKLAKHWVPIERIRTLFGSKKIEGVFSFACFGARHLDLGNQITGSISETLVSSPISPPSINEMVGIGFSPLHSSTQRLNGLLRKLFSQCVPEE